MVEGSSQLRTQTASGRALMGCDVNIDSGTNTAVAGLFCRGCKLLSFQLFYPFLLSLAKFKFLLHEKQAQTMVYIVKIVGNIFMKIF